MPGIAGVLHVTAALAKSDLLPCMVERMRHDPAWAAGHDACPDLDAAFGWVSRSDSFAGPTQPVWNADRTIGLIFSGEHFETPERIADHQRRDSDAAGLAGLVRLYENLGTRFFSQLNGWFAGLILDLRERKAILFNDRYGLGRIYLHESPDGLFFASEAKALLAALPATRELDPRGLAESVSMGCVLQNRTLFRDISLLPPGSQWTFHRDGRVEKVRYFDPKTWEEQEPLSPEAYAENLQDVFRRVAPGYVRGSAGVGMSLTGGLDSRMLLAWAGAEPGALPCYTFGGPYRDCADLRLARGLAALAGQPHMTLPIGNDFFRDFSTLAERTVYLSDGNMDVSGAVELHANARAREIAPIRVTGNYGSEILRANVAFRPRRMDRSLFTPEFSKRIDEAEETYRTEAAGSRLSFIAFKQVPWHHYGRLSVEQSQLTVRSPFLDNELVGLAYRVPPSLASSPLPALALIAAGNPDFDTLATDRALRYRPRPIADGVAHAWQEFTAKAEYAYDYGMPPWLARLDHRLSPLGLERLFLGRHKFYHFRIWYKRQLRDSLEAMGESLSTPEGIYQPGVPTRLIQEHVGGNANHTTAIHQMLTLSLTQAKLIDAPWAI